MSDGWVNRGGGTYVREFYGVIQRHAVNLMWEFYPWGHDSTYRHGPFSSLKKAKECAEVEHARKVKP